MTMMEDAQILQVNLKRKRSSPSISSPAPPPPPPKALKISGAALQINYLARRSPQDLPLIDKNERLPGIIDVLSAYTSVLERNESLASNLGARPLGPILIKRFERCFDAPPQIITSHSHAKDSADAPQVTWLEVIQFAQSHPGQFTLSNQVEGRPVCQFYYPQKQSRVQVSEEDYLFIKSGRCQDLIPPLPIWEDEEKEVGTCEILEKSLRDLTHAADTVGARARQLAHRLKSRRMAIMERRAGETSANGTADHHNSAGEEGSAEHHPTISMTNGQNTAGATADVSVRNDLLRHFQAKSQSQSESARRLSSAHATATTSPVEPPGHEPVSPTAPSQPYARPDERNDVLSCYLADSATPLPPVSLPSGQRESKHNFSRPLKPDAEITQPFRAVCQAHMESLGRGARVMPPCDRCRRLRMDCLKNLTSCQGCTKKHARCHWREVERHEVEGLDAPGHERSGHGSGAENGSGNAGALSGSDQEGDEESEDEGMGALQDLEALDRQSDEEMMSAADHSANSSIMDVDEHSPKSNIPRAPAASNDGVRAASNNEEKPQIVAVSGAQSVAEAGDRARNVYGDGLPYSPPPVKHAYSVDDGASSRKQPIDTPAPRAQSPPSPPQRPRQGSYGFPPLDTAAASQDARRRSPAPKSEHGAVNAPHKHVHVHVATPHPGDHRRGAVGGGGPGGFTSVNAGSAAYGGGVNGDSSVKPPVPDAWAERDGDSGNIAPVPARIPGGAVGGGQGWRGA